MPSHSFFFYFVEHSAYVDSPRKIVLKRQRKKRKRWETDNGLNMNKEILPGEDKAVCVAGVSPCELKKDDKYMFCLYKDV